MISVIIPLLAHPPYDEQIKITIDGLEKQTADLEIIVSEQAVVKKTDKIYKSKLLNEGFAKSKGDIIFHCDADIIFEDPTLLARMEKKLRDDDLDVIYPLFWARTIKFWKIADGHPFMTREARVDGGKKMREDCIGISLQEFLILHYLYFNKKFHCSKEFKIKTNNKPFIKTVNKVHRNTRIFCRPKAVEVIAELKKDGVWPP